MAESIRRNTSRESIVIPDPVEGPRGIPNFAPKMPRLNVVWFGHPSNLGGVTHQLDQLTALADKIPVQFRIVTSPTAEAVALAAQIAADDPSRLRAVVVPWSLESTWRALEETDVVWIPVAGSEQKTVKSANRLLESLWAGRLRLRPPLGGGARRRGRPAAAPESRMR